jgi:hypothetical protein
MVKIDNNNFNYILSHPYLLTPHKFNLMKTKDELLYNNIYNDYGYKIFNYKLIVIILIVYIIHLYLQIIILNIIYILI